jgi:hypothetical protein
MSRKKDTPKKKDNYDKLLAYLSDPSHGMLDRAEWSTLILGYKQAHSIYSHFSSDELNQIEWEALEIRRKRYASELSKVDKGVLEKAASGDSAAAKLAYQKFEGWNEKTTTELELKLPMLEKILGALPEEYAERVREALLKKVKK